MFISLEIDDGKITTKALVMQTVNDITTIRTLGLCMIHTTIKTKCGSPDWSQQQWREPRCGCSCLHFTECIDSITKEKHRSKKAIPVTGHGDLKGCEMSRIPHFLNNPTYRWQ
jgi:hypothetical protein